ncbi:MAG: M28 family peptidase [Anaerolineaceae bacterium]|nr:M28 family peptidase [Anaerolineaceae bacterium]
MRSHKKQIIVVGTILAIFALTSALFLLLTSKISIAFDGKRALKDVYYQIHLGPRLPGSEAHARTIEWISQTLNKEGWEIEIQELEANGKPIKNIIAKRGSGKPWIILGAHYDSRFYADQDPVIENRTLPVPGANDGASGVAVLIELGRVLPKNLEKQVWLVFFDAEDQGNIPGWDWILGSKAFVNALIDKPDAVVVIDMIGDKDLNIFQEKNSDPELTRIIWAIAKDSGYATQFIDQPKYSILDDHYPFLEKGIPAIDIIDFDYPFWHTTGDTIDQVSPDSLSAVGTTLFNWLTQP